MIQTRMKSAWSVTLIANPEAPAKGFKRLGTFDTEAEAIAWRDANAPDAKVSECLNVRFF